MSKNCVQEILGFQTHMFSALVRGWLLWLSLQLLWFFFSAPSAAASRCGLTNSSSFIISQAHAGYKAPGSAQHHRILSNLSRQSVRAYFYWWHEKVLCFYFSLGLRVLLVLWTLKLWQFVCHWRFARGNGAEAPCESSRLQAMFVRSKVKESCRENK